MRGARERPGDFTHFVLIYGYMTHKKLYRSHTDEMISGVCGGFAEYLDIDATLIRLIWALIVLFTGIFPGVVVYILAAMIMPYKPTGKS